MTKTTVNIPHSWPIGEWPPGIYPGTPSKAKYITRAYLKELVEAGAIARVGRERLIIGPRYVRWLEKKCAAVIGFECAANRRKQPSAEAA